jgi:hypothetical protein
MLGEQMCCLDQSNIVEFVDFDNSDRADLPLVATGIFRMLVFVYLLFKVIEMGVILKEEGCIVST